MGKNTTIKNMNSIHITNTITGGILIMSILKAESIRIGMCIIQHGITMRTGRRDMFTIGTTMFISIDVSKFSFYTPEESGLP
jgi:hypothetical protein